MNKLEITYMNTNDLIPYEHNPRINDMAVEKVADSINEFGFKNPIIIDGNNVIIAGHTRLKAAKLLELDKVPVIQTTDLSDEKVRAFRIADNRVSEEAEWDIDLLMKELDDLAEFEYTDLGFNFGELELDDLEDVLLEKSNNTQQLNYLTFTSYKIPMSADEVEALEQRIENYQDEMGSNFGFVNAMLRGD